MIYAIILIIFFVISLYLVTLRKESKIEITKTELIMTYTPRQIADYFLYIGKNDTTMTPMKLIKLVYIAHGWNLGLFNKPLINESPQAWKYGPVIPSLYDDFKSYGNQKIEKEVVKPELDENTEKFLNKIWDVYSKYTGIQLSAKTHEPNTPWSIIWEKAKQYFNNFSLSIPNELIKEHYQLKIQK